MATVLKTSVFAAVSDFASCSSAANARPFQ